jgi:hypothetical protein
MKRSVRQTLPFWKAIFVIPLFCFLVLSFLSWKRGQEGKWHEQCVEFWQKQQWQQLISLGENLWQAGQGDAEALCFAMLASSELKDSELSRKFGERLLGQKLLNQKIERSIRTVIQPDSVLSIVQLHRTVATLVLFPLLTGICTISNRKSALLPWVSVIAILGIVILRI